MIDLHVRAGSATENGDPLVVTPERAGWTYTGLRVVRLSAGNSRELLTGNEELAVLPLSGSAVLEIDGQRFKLEGRETVFARVSDWAYVPIDAELRLSSRHGCELALASARASRRLEPVYVPAISVPIEIRGAGPATRQVNNFMTPETFPGAERLDLRRSLDSRRQLVLLSAAQA